MTTPPPAVTAEEAKDAASILVSWCPADRQSPFDVVMRYIEQTSRATCLAAAPKGWMPIETAPKDGTEVLLYWAGPSGDHLYEIGRAGEEHWLHGMATQWMPLPPAPDAAPAASSPEAADERTALVIAGWQAAIDCHTRHGMAGWSSHRDDYIRAALAVAADEGRDKALRDAATSLETIAALAGRKTYGDPPIETYMDTFMDVRLYAAARAKVAREALPAASQDEHQEQG